MYFSSSRFRLLHSVFTVVRSVLRFFRIAQFAPLQKVKQRAVERVKTVFGRNIRNFFLFFYRFCFGQSPSRGVFEFERQRRRAVSTEARKRLHRQQLLVVLFSERCTTTYSLNDNFYKYYAAAIVSVSSRFNKIGF